MEVVFRYPWRYYTRYLGFVAGFAVSFFILKDGLGDVPAYMFLLVAGILNSFLMGEYMFFRLREPWRLVVAGETLLVSWLRREGRYSLRDFRIVETPRRGKTAETWIELRSERVSFKVFSSLRGFDEFVRLVEQQRARGQ